MSDQPPEVGPDPAPDDLPPASAAADRVLAYVAAWGDGEIDSIGPNVALYARDLVAVAQDVLDVERLTGDTTVEACAYALYAHDVRASWPSANAGADPAISWRDEGPAGVTGRARYRSRAAAVLQAAVEVRRATQ